MLNFFLSRLANKTNEILSNLTSPSAEVLLRTHTNHFEQTYTSLALYLFLCFAICLVLALVAYLLSLSSDQDGEKKSEYECGFEPFDSATRLPFDVHYYLVGILFLIFDVEIALLLPWVLSLNFQTWFGFYVRRNFIGILSVGFLYEWDRGALIWPSQQKEAAYKAFLLDPSLLFLLCLVAYKIIAWLDECRFEWSTCVESVFQVIDDYNARLLEYRYYPTAILLFLPTLIRLAWVRWKQDKALPKEEETKIEESKKSPETKVTKVKEEESKKSPETKVADVKEDAGKKTDETQDSSTDSTKKGGLLIFSTAETANAWQDILSFDSWSYAEQIFLGLGPESALVFLIRYLLVALALERKQKSSKAQLANLSLQGASYFLCFISLAYFVQYLSKLCCLRFHGYIRTSTYVSIRKLIALSSCGFVLANSRKYVANHKQHLLEYAIVFVLTALFRMLVISSSNFRSAFRSIVGFSLNLYVLILFDASKSAGREAGVKYYFLSTFSSGLMLYGIFLFFISTGTLSLFASALSISNSIEVSTETPIRLQIGLALLFTGLFFKLSAFPGHLWAAEVYEGSPDPVTAFFRLPTKITVLSFLALVLMVAVAPLSFSWQSFLRLSAGVSLLWGSFGALGEKSTKRFLAYASINQIGFLLLGLTSTNLSGCKFTLVYLFVYAVRNFGFLTRFLSAQRKQGGKLLYLTDFRGLGQQNWLISWSSARRLFSRAGIPPLAGFFGKYFLLLNLQSNGRYLLVVIALATSLLSAYYYLRLVKTLWFEGKNSRIAVTCNLLISQQVTLFCAEGALWTFARFSGPILLFSKNLTIALVAPAA